MPERSSRSHTSSTASCSRCPGGRESSPDTSPPPSSRKSVSTRGAQRAENRVQLCADRAGEAALEHVRPVPGRAERQMPPVGVELLGRHGTVRVDPVHDLPASCSSSAGGNVAPNPREAGRRGRGRQGRTRDRRPPPGRAGTRRPASARPPRPVAPRPAPDAGAPEVPGHRDPRAELHDGADPTARLTPHDRRSAYTSTAARLGWVNVSGSRRASPPRTGRWSTSRLGDEPAPAGARAPPASGRRDRPDRRPRPPSPDGPPRSTGARAWSTAVASLPAISMTST